MYDPNLLASVKEARRKMATGISSFDMDKYHVQGNMTMILFKDGSKYWLPGADYLDQLVAAIEGGYEVRYRYDASADRIFPASKQPVTVQAPAPQLEAQMQAKGPSDDWFNV